MLAEWNDSFSVGVPAIDQQHKTLFNLINKLSQGITDKKGRQILGEVLDEMVQYTESHFADEERLMRERDYPALAKHKEEHDAMTAKLAQFRERYQAGQADLSLEVLMELIDWLHEHMGQSDASLKPYIAA